MGLVFLCNIDPEHNLRWINTSRGLVLQEKVKGRNDSKDYWVWRDVPIIEEEKIDKVYNDENVAYD